MTLSEAIDMLPGHLFLQTHRSHLVNLHYAAELIREGRRRELRLTTGERIPISRGRVGSVQSRIRDFLAADRRRKALQQPRTVVSSSSLPQERGGLQRSY